jgi:hypothetical protein
VLVTVLHHHPILGKEIESAIGHSSYENKRCRRRHGMKISVIGEGAE